MRWNGETPEQVARKKEQKLANWHVKFAFIPKQMQDGSWVWLETYYQRYVYDIYEPYEFQIKRIPSDKFYTD